MQAKKTVTVGTGPFAEAALGKFYIAEDGAISQKAPEGKYEIGCDTLFQITIPNMSPELVALAVAHSFTRKLQEYVQAVGKKEMDPDEAGVAFAAHYETVMKHEKAEKVKGPKLEGPEAAAINNLTGFYVCKAAGVQGGTAEEKKAAKKAATKEDKQAARKLAMADKTAETANWKKALKKAQEAEALSFE